MICWPDRANGVAGAVRPMLAAGLLLLASFQNGFARANAEAQVQVETEPAVQNQTQTAPTTGPLNAAHLINRAIDLIEAGDYALARTYLAPALIHPRLRSAARAQAYYLRGYSYQSQHLHVSARKDYYRALEFDADNGSAQAALAGLYLYGEGTRRDPALGLTLLQAAMDNGQESAVFHLGYAYLHGEGVEQDIEQGRALLEQAAAAGDSNAMTHLGASYRKDFTDAPDAEQALGWYDQAIAAGNAGAMVAKSYMLRSGELGTADPAAAKALIEQAAASGNANARISLSHLYLTGEGVPEDPAKAYALLTDGAQAPGAVPELHYRLGYLQQYGLGTEIDLAAAMASYRRAASGGISGAMSRLAYMLMGRSDAQSQSQAGYWLSRATHSDSADAYNEYAWFLATTPVAELRDGDLAVANAEKAVARERNASYLDTLAAAHAEAGSFPEAISAQQEALALAGEQQPEIVADLQIHLAAYQQGKPWREPSQVQQVAP